jgi:hypothetical protein
MKNIRRHLRSEAQVRKNMNEPVSEPLTKGSAVGKATESSELSG